MAQPDMHPEKIANLLRQTPDERLRYFVRCCADFEEVWGLMVGQDGWVIFDDHEGDSIFPVWPHRSIAEICCFDEHRKMGAEPQRIALDAFLTRCVPDTASRGVYFGVFFDRDREGIAIPAMELGSALRDEYEAHL